jgi:hypothetical protein
MKFERASTAFGRVETFCHTGLCCSSRYSTVPAGTVPYVLASKPVSVALYGTNSGVRVADRWLTMVGAFVVCAKIFFTGHTNYVVVV